MSATKKGRQSRRKAFLKGGQTKMPEKHHWYFEKTNATSDDYALVVGSLFEPNNEPKGMFNYAVVSFKFDAEKRGDKFKVNAVIRGFVQLKSPNKCTKQTFLDMIDADVEAFEPEDTIYDYAEERIQADSFRFLVLSDNKGSVEGGTLRRRGPPRLLVEPEETEDPSWKGTTSRGYGQVEVPKELLTDNWDNFCTNHNESSPDRNISRSERLIFPVHGYVPNVASGSVAIVDHKYGTKRKSSEKFIVDPHDEDRERNRKPTKKSTMAYRDVSEGTSGKQHLFSSGNKRTDQKVASKQTKIVECSHVPKKRPSKNLAQLFSTLNGLSSEELQELGFKRDDTKKSAVPLEATETDDLSESEKVEKSPHINPDDEES